MKTRKHEQSIFDILTQLRDRLRDENVYPQNDAHVRDMFDAIDHAISYTSKVEQAADVLRRKREAMEPGLKLKRISDARHLFFWHPSDLGFTADKSPQNHASYTTDIVYEAIVACFMEKITIPKGKITDDYVTNITKSFIDKALARGIGHWKSIFTPLHPTGITETTAKERIKAHLLKKITKRGSKNENHIHYDK